jgi:hypothetical protein
MRCELLAVRRRVARVERAVFAADTQHLRTRLPGHLMEALPELCHDANGDRPADSPAASDNVITFRSDPAICTGGFEIRSGRRRDGKRSV